ncbi:universal stress protein [Elizabethkingia anophelis]|uniref:universal stress protein n=1 Tax=Elizabethkingia anophelis TaxID=1117645 RepID=UPI0012B29C65|nr:universal stress protein [Elizabethkingia anophelis]QGN22546.1 universal stress protein [Elizabethkingia anophelis]QNV09198.1 universal stress protein [Elizabethkingia anophelis]UTF90954.1 universal stress protein [Elizabethkingia anophelis]UTG01824.1 universal stress protein [Elizabethkingia anophelis]UTG05574.1 universal stress protein [Elizabethkingia anophelis]
MKQIIVATDFSAEAGNALTYIVDCIKGRDDYGIILFTLQNPSIHSINARLSPDAISATLSGANEKLRLLAHDITTRHGIEVIPYFSTGLFYDQIKTCIQAHSALLLVMGMAKRSFEQDMLGNTTTTAINRLKIPILSIPIDIKFTGLKHILLAYDMERGIPRKILESIHFFATEFGAEVEIFNVWKQIENLDRIAKKDTSIEETMKGTTYYYKNAESHKVVEAIRSEVLESGTDVLIMVHYRYGFWQSLVHRSKTRMMASGSNIPLLSISL